MKRITFIFWRARSSGFSVVRQPVRKRTQLDQITDDNSQQIIQDERSAESIISSIPSARQPAIWLAIALMFVTPRCSRLLADDDHNPIGVTGVFEGVTTT